jgi:branched-subunit amino acid transport protein
MASSTTTVWLTIGLLAAGTIGIKALGPVTLGSRSLPVRAGAVIGLLAPPILTALVLVETIGDRDGGVQIDARLGGLAAAAVAIALRLPTLAVVVLAAIGAAGLRALA